MKSAVLNLDLIYESVKERKSFLKRLKSFYKSDANLKDIIKIQKNNSKLIYNYNELICANNIVGKKNVALVFGNPSPHSIKEEVMFSYEGASFKTHRVWKVLQDTGIIDIDISLLNQSLNDYKTKGIKRNILIRSGKASNKFNLTFFSYFTFPSASSDIKWSGVAGLKKLFGARAWNKIKLIEHSRFMENLKSLPSDIKMIAFQKDAYVNIIQNSENLDIELMSPTRLWYSQKVKNYFHRIAK